MGTWSTSYLTTWTLYIDESLSYFLLRLSEVSTWYLVSVIPIVIATTFMDLLTARQMVLTEEHFCQVWIHIGSRLDLPIFSENSFRRDRVPERDFFGWDEALRHDINKRSELTISALLWTVPQKLQSRAPSRAKFALTKTCSCSALSLCS